MEHLLWKQVLEIVEDRVHSHVYETWFKPTEQLSYQDDILTISVPNRFHKDWLCSDEYSTIIRNSLGEVSKEIPSIRFEVCNHVGSQETVAAAPEPKPAPGEGGGWPHRLNPSYTFENFVVGASNQFAHAASMAVSESPAVAYNPLFIYGGVGLGKTHLMHAIGHQVLKKSHPFKLLYITSEGFVNDLISSLQRDRMESFRNKYRNIDVLLVDDIQFIAGKDRTQEEFFHTFNTLHESSKQIVISCDKFPKEISGLEERLRSRFEWGLIADIQLPDLETKIAIMNKKAETLGVKIPSDVSYYIASKIKSNIRELEGCLLRLSALSDLTGSSINLDMVKKYLGGVLCIEKSPPSIDKIQKTVSEYFQMTISDLKSKKRNKSIAIPRQIAMYLIRENTSSSLPEIGRAFGNKDHSTVLHSCRKVKALLDSGSNEIAEAAKVISDKLDL